jgi:tetratricopeptide (TPR) repeat protein
MPIDIENGPLKAAARFAVGILDQPASTRRQLVGADGFGKTTFLQAMREPISRRNALPVFVSPPIQDADTGCSALLQIAEQLHRAGMMNGEFGEVTAPNVAWGRKLDVTKEAISRNAGGITLLLDEPNKWTLPQNAESRQDSFSSMHADQIAKFVRFEAQCRRIETTTWSPPDDCSEKFIFKSLDLPLNQIDWGTLDPIASELKKRLGANLSQATYLEMKLLVALASVTSISDVVSFQARYPTPWSIAKAFIQAIKENSKWQQLWKVLSFSGFVRGAMAPGLVGVLGENALNEEERNVLDSALLSHAGDVTEIHPIVKETINKAAQFSLPEKQDYHQRLATFYSQLTGPETDHWGTESQIRVEEFHHAATAGDMNAVEKAFFVDQLHILGRTLSRDRKDYHAAASVFRKVIALDASDDYGHHYLAYNLDCAATDVATVEAEYKEAVRLNSVHPWWRSRWINLLITTGRIPDAQREWNFSSTTLQTGGGNAEPWVYEHLHKWVARLLLHRAQLDFAENVLEELPEELRNADAGFRSLDRLLTSMKIARDARAVFPISIPPEEHWRGPHLYFYETTAGRRLKQWNPARIDAIDENSLSLIVGKRDEQSGTVIYGNVELPVTKFNDASLDGRADQLTVGRFIEMAFYGDDGWLKIRIHRDKFYSDPDLPYFDPPNPRRYLQKETASP